MRYDLLHPKALQAALAKRYGKEYPVPKERQVRRWVSGDTPLPGWARRAIDEIMEAPQHEESPPAWAEGLANEAAKKAIGELIPAEVLRSLPELIARLEALQPPSGGASGDPRSGSDRDATGRRRPGAG